jgi:hypothetical protein
MSSVGRRVGFLLTVIAAKEIERAVCDDGAIDTIAIPDHVTRSPIPRKGLGDLACDPVPVVNLIGLAGSGESGDAAVAMRDLCRLISWMVVDLIRSRAALEAETWTLRQQMNVLRRGAWPSQRLFAQK